MRALTSGAQWLCSRAYQKPRTTIFLERSAPFLAAANRLFHVDWKLAVWNKNWRLSKTDSLLTPWKYGTDEIAHLGITNLQAVLFLTRNIKHEHTRAKSISGRYPTLYASLTIQLPTGRLYALVNAGTRGAWRAPERCARHSKATGNLERHKEMELLPERTSGMFLQWWGTPWSPWAWAACSSCPVLRSISAARAAGTRPEEVPWTLNTQPASPAPRPGQNSRRAWLWTSGHCFQISLWSDEHYSG